MTAVWGDIVAGVADVFLAGGLLVVTAVFVVYVVGSTVYALLSRHKRPVVQVPRQRGGGQS